MNAVFVVLVGFLALAGCQPLDDEAYCTGTVAMYGPHCADWRERHWISSEPG